MVSPILRSNWGEATQRNINSRPAWAATVYSRPGLGPLPPSRGLDRRDNPAYPHPENPGLIEDADGYYDWAGRRLFLETGEPDPETPGAYRYQTRPDLTDLDAPDEDPMSPRYEPCWHTGRHRQGESSDHSPLPDWQAEQPSPDLVWNGAPMDVYDQHEHFRRELGPEPEPEPSPPQPSAELSLALWEETDADDAYLFSSLQERAWGQFVIDSESLAASNRENWRCRLGQRNRCGWFAAALDRVRRWVIGLFRRTKTTHIAPAVTGSRTAALPAKQDPAVRAEVPASPVAAQVAPPYRAPRTQDPVTPVDMRANPRQARPEPEQRLPRLEFDGSAVGRSGETRSFSASQRGHSMPGPDWERRSPDGSNLLLRQLLDRRSEPELSSDPVPGQVANHRRRGAYRRRAREP